MPKTPEMWLVFAVAAAIAACSDDDAVPVSDAGPDGSAGTGEGGRGGADSGRPVAGNGGAGVDGGDACSAHPKVSMPLWDSAEIAAVFTRRASLAELCPQGCGGSLAEFMADLECHPVDDIDGGSSAPDWIRSEGCGSVQFSTPLPSFISRVHNFDADSGELVGYAQLEDAADSPGRIRGCSSFGWLGGEIRAQCADERVSDCERRR